MSAEDWRDKLGVATQRARTARRHYAFVAPPELAQPQRHVPVIIVGAGPVGLGMAAELAAHGTPSLVLEKGDTSSDGSRAICWAKRTLEICDRWGIAADMQAKGVTWNIGKVFEGDAREPLYTFDLLPIKAQQFPAFVNLQQYYVEEFLSDALAARMEVDLRWRHEVIAVTQDADSVELTVATPGGNFAITADYVIAADGCRSPLRALLGLDFAGRTFEDHFLIADVRMHAPFAAERRFYFNAPFNDGRTALMHQQPDDLWRLDFQLGHDFDRTAALDPDNVSAKVRAMLGPEIEFEYEWVSLYSFQCRRMAQFVHGRIIFVGDAAHLVSPFGARGANGGLQDVDNLGWKLTRVMRGNAPAALLTSYDEERAIGADENIRHSTRATDFMTPKSPGAQALQSAALELARDFPFARTLVNSGRLSVPCSLRKSSLVTPDVDEFHTPGLEPGAVALDAPVIIDGRSGWILQVLGGRFCLLAFGVRPAPVGLPGELRALVVGEDITDSSGILASRYDARPGTVYLIRPDQHVAARWRRYNGDDVMRAWRRSLAIPTQH